MDSQPPPRAGQPWGALWPVPLLGGTLSYSEALTHLFHSRVGQPQMTGITVFFPLPFFGGIGTQRSGGGQKEAWPGRRLRGLRQTFGTTQFRFLPQFRSHAISRHNSTLQASFCQKEWPSLSPLTLAMSVPRVFLCTPLNFKVKLEMKGRRNEYWSTNQPQ